MKVLEKQEKAHRVMVSILPIGNDGKKTKGSKSLTVLGTNVDEVYAVILEALRKGES